MKIVVTTPTGHVGSRVVRLLVQAGLRPTVLVRRASRLDPVLRARCEVVEGDQGDLAAVRRATAGADALYWVDPPTGDDGPVAGYARMGEVAAALRSPPEPPRGPVHRPRRTRSKVSRAVSHEVLPTSKWSVSMYTPIQH